MPVCVRSAPAGGGLDRYLILYLKHSVLCQDIVSHASVLSANALQALCVKEWFAKSEFLIL